jgi:uncharacterized protein (DUF169 family)
MNLLRTLESRFGGWWTGIKFHQDGELPGKMAATPMRLCEAVTQSRTQSITLSKSLLNCPGASHCMGWGPDDREIAMLTARELGLPESALMPIVESTPKFETGLGGITIGTYDHADIAVSFAQPANIMGLLRQYQLVFGIRLAVQISSFMGVCGNVAAGAHVHQKMCLSFGCPHSRSHAHIGRDRLIVGLPVSMIATLLQRRPSEPTQALENKIAAVS